MACDLAKTNFNTSVWFIQFAIVLEHMNSRIDIGANNKALRVINSTVGLRMFVSDSGRTMRCLNERLTCTCILRNVKKQTVIPR